MNSNALASWIQVVTGLAALVVSILTGLPALRGIEAAGTATTLTGLGAAQSGLVVFATLIVFSIGMIFVIVGISALLGAAFRAHGAASPIHAAYCVTIAGVCVAGSASLAIFSSTAWVIPALFALMCIVLAGQAQADPGKGTFWGLCVVGSVAIIVAGSLVAAGMAGLLPDSSTTDDRRSAAADQAVDDSASAAAAAAGGRRRD